MSYTKLFKLLGNGIKLTSFITNISSDNIDVPFIIKETLNILEDENPFFNIITDSNKKALCMMMNQYFTECWMVYIEDIPFDKLIAYGKMEVYKVEAANGIRYATVNEVAQGVRGLIRNYIYIAGEEEYKKLCLLYWTFCGKSYYFSQVGYSSIMKYDDNGQLITSFYEMIFTCANELKALFEWIAIPGNLDNTLKKIKKLKANNGYKYASFEKDEIKEDITIKQLLYNIHKVFPRNSDNIEYRRALALSIKAYKDSKKLSPLEISTLRDTYEKHALDANKSKQVNDEETQDDLKQKCELILKEQYSGKINPKHFAFKIIGTLKKGNYLKCSPKQYSIIEDALINLQSDNNKTKENNNKNAEIISEEDIDMSLYEMSNAIGEGLYED